MLFIRSGVLRLPLTDSGMFSAIINHKIGFEMRKNKRKIIRDMLFEVYDKGVQNKECNLDFYYEKMMQALNIPCVIKSVCVAPKGECDRKQEDVCKECEGCKYLKQTVL